MAQPDSRKRFSISRGASARADPARSASHPRYPRPGLAAVCALVVVPLIVWGAATARAERVANALGNLLRSAGLAGAEARSNVLTIRYPPISYAGRDSGGVPYYTRRPFSPTERQLILREFGVEHPENLYLSDSTPNAVLLYDTERDCGESCLVSSYRVGAPSVRRRGESWEAMENRVMQIPPARFPHEARIQTRSLSALSPDARGAFDTLLTAARAAGFELRVTESSRSPERQAYLLRRGMTYTATSLHSDRRAIDVVVGNGRQHDRRNRARWIAFRRWVEAYDSGRFRLIGSADSSWDWPHIELPNRGVGFRSIEELLDSAALRAADSSHPSRAGRASE